MSEMKKEWSKWFLTFMVFSLIGWVYELLVYRFELGYGYLNRGFLFGPYLPVYGFGGLLMLMALKKYKDRRIVIGGITVTPLVCFVIAVIVATAAELLTSYLMEAVIGEWLWDYSMDFPNFQGRIALKSSLRFGIMGLVGIYIIYPLIFGFAGSVQKKQPVVYRLVSSGIFIFFIADVAARFFLGSNYTGP